MVESAAAANNTPEPAEPVDRISELILRVAAGDHAAFDELYRLMLVSSLGVARRILRDTHLAEDAMAEAAARVWKAASRFEPGNGRGWYLTIVRHVAISMAKSRGRSDVISPEHATDAADRQQRVIDSDGVHVSAEEADYLGRMRQARWFQRLSRRDQRIMVLRYLGFPNVEIIRLLPEVTHNELISRARRRAARYLAEDHPDLF